MRRSVDELVCLVEIGHLDGKSNDEIRLHSIIGIGLVLPSPLHLELGMGNLEWISEQHDPPSSPSTESAGTGRCLQALARLASHGDTLFPRDV
jgi:hypothetical protein